jgi:hypothetical protein
VNYRWVLYVCGARSQWGKMLHPGDTIAEGGGPWHWLARWTMLAKWRGLNPAVVCYALQRDGVTIEQYEPDSLAGSVPQP